MTENTYRISGKIVNVKSRAGIPGLRVEAWDKDLIFDDLVGSAFADGQGVFQMTFDESYFSEIFVDRRPDLYFKVFRDKDLLKNTKDSTWWNAPQGDVSITIEIDSSHEGQPGDPVYRVHGIVLDSHGKPVQHVFVQAYDRDLRKLQPLGTVVETEVNGGFRIDYKLSDFQLGDPPSRRAPWLIVEVRERPEGNVLASQELQRAEPIQYIEFKLPGEVASEWQRVGEAVEPLLKGQGTSGVEANSHTVESEVQTDLKPFELNAADIEFIMLETGLEPAAVEAWVASSKIVRDAVLRLTDEHAAQQATLRDNGWPFFYGIARQGLARDLDAVLRESSADWQRTWRTARSANRVPVLEEKQLKLLVDVLELLQRLQQLDPVRSGNSDFARVLASTSMPLPTAVALDALSIFNEKGLDDPEALLKLAERHPDAEAPIKTFVRGARVHQFVSGHVALFSTLNARMEGSTSDSIAPLAALPSTEWMVMADEAAISHGRALLLQAQVEKQHPLTALKARLDTGRMQLPGVSGGEMVALVKEQPATVESILRGITPVKDHGDETPPATHKVLRDVGRFVRTGVNMELAVHLMNTGIETPAVAIRYGQEHIREQLRDELPKEAADEIAYTFFEIVEPVLDGANGFLIDVAGGRALPWWMVEEYKIPLPESVRENLPSLPGLFGDLDECICKPCESMLGQPAYLVDLLNLLKKCPSDNPDNPTAFDLLKLKRSDITDDLKLSCENSESKIQHIDIALEVLEKGSGLNPYQQLANTVFPWHLPFNLSLAEIKAYLGKLNLTRLDLLLLLGNVEPMVLAAETLNYSASQTVNQTTLPEWQLFTVKRSGVALWEVYGISPNTSWQVTLVDPASNEQLNNLPVTDVLLRVSVLLDRTGLDLDSLEQIIATQYIGNLSISNRQQCKTSTMRLVVAADQVEASLDRIHRFVRLRNKLSEWSVTEIDSTIVAFNGLESSTTTEVDRENLLIKLALIKRLHDRYGFSIADLVKLPASINRIYPSLGLSAYQFSLLKTLIGLEFTSAGFDWTKFENFCVAVERISETGLTIEQTAEALLPKSQLDVLRQPISSSIKTDEQINCILETLQQRLRSVVAINPEDNLETLLLNALTEALGADNANIIMQAISKTGSKGATPSTLNQATFDRLVGILHNKPEADHFLGDWSPLLPEILARELFTVSTSNNLNEEARFNKLLAGIKPGFRERELIVAVSDFSRLAESEVISLLNVRLWLDPEIANQHDFAYELFLDQAFWGNIDLQSVDIHILGRLKAWVDRLYRFLALKIQLKIDSEFLNLADRVVVGNRTGINWRDLLATGPSMHGGGWSAWQTLQDLLWLQQPDSLSRTALKELFVNLEARLNLPILPETLQPIAVRLGLTTAQIFDVLDKTMTTTNARELLNPSQLRNAFELLMLANHLGADGTQIINLIYVHDNAQAASTVKQLVEERVAQNGLPDTLQVIRDSLRRQRRDALVAYLVTNFGLRDANGLYEYYLIDPQMEPCFETTRILEAITATQLFAQRILFGIEDGISASDELKQRWTWMRNYRVWEANRKVFLFPENWLFPELRDDKSSSFKQLESALGQGELNQDLARQSFGQFLDDVAQIGQTHVLGMFEHVREGQRDLYVVGRSANPPYLYYWRKCVDLGSRLMEWMPWQRIELEIEGDHVLPFVLNEELYIAWPMIQRLAGTDTKPDKWQVHLALARYSGSAWKRRIQSRDPKTVDVVSFSDNRAGFALRYEPPTMGSDPRISIYYQSEVTGYETSVPPAPVPPTPPPTFVLGPEYYEPTKLANHIRTNPAYLPEEYKGVLRTYANKLWYQGHDYGVGGADWWRMLDIFTDDKTFQPPAGPPVEYFNFDAVAKAADEIRRNSLLEQTWEQQIDVLTGFLEYFKSKNLVNIRNQSAWDEFVRAIAAKSSRLNIKCRTWINLKYEDEQRGFKEVATPSNKFVSKIGPNNYISLKPFKPGDPNVVGVDYEIVRLGPIEIQHVSMTYVENFPDKILPPSIVPTVRVELGSSVEQTLHFELNGTMFYALDLGFSIDDDIVLNQRIVFQVTPEDSIIADVGNGSALIKWVENSRPWMNGFQEKYKTLNEPARITSSTGSQINIIPASIQQFWVVGASGSDVSSAMPRVLYLKEGQSRLFVDLGVLTGLPDSGLKAFPESYQAAIQRKRRWSSSKENWGNPDDQLDVFGAMDLGANSILASDDYSKTMLGALAFDARLPYACYNWEVFFHAPLLIADQLSKQHKFEDAERWLRYVFDPTSSGSGTDAKRFLKFRVFNELDLNKQVIDDLTALAQAAGGLATEADIAAVNKLINRWRDAPFRPFLIARRRHIAFLWRTLFAYLDNLIAWADSLYRRDTIESINEATMLYVLAERILGRRPQLHKGSSNREALSYEAMAGKWDEFANYWIDAATRNNSNRPTQWRLKSEKKQPNPDGMLFFCMPFNDKIFSYWETIEARLSNVRNCRNIEGIERKLPLMDAPIDPELLIRATAAGLDLGDVIAGLYAPPPHYRYSILSARASELTNEAKSLGAAMLSAIEKRDAEHLAQLRSSNEISLLKLVSEVRKLQITEAERNIEALRASRRSVSTRYSQYQRLLGKKDIKVPNEHESVGEESMLGSVDSGLSSNRSNWGLIKEENEQYVGFEGANTWFIAASLAKVTGGGFQAAAALIAPNKLADEVSNASKTLNFLGQASAVLGDGFSIGSQAWRAYAEQQGMMAGHLRRRDEWAFQSNQALKELQQIDKQILANDIRTRITRKELDNHIEQIEQAQAVDEVMRSKFSNEQLYEWMKSQLSSLYFNAYRMALEMARRAERAAARELGVKPLNILRNDYWNSLREGLLAGERLHQDIKRLEVTYLDQNRREYELTKHISLRRLDPEALVNLRIKDDERHCKCDFNIPEWLFDLDTPGHYLRRIKSVSVSIPCVVGPYASVNCKLTLVKSEVRHDRTAAEGTYPRSTTVDDPRFIDYFGASEAIVTSTGNGDSGLFETQLRDERFLPFEGSGVISTWRLELPGEYPQFDYSTISDVLLSIRYTARDGGDTLRDTATSAINTQLSSAAEPLRFPVVLSCRSDFPTEWARTGSDSDSELKISITRDMLPYWMDAIRPKLVVREVKFTDLLEDPTNMPTFDPPVWPPQSGVTNAIDTLNTDGFGEANLGSVASEVTDRIVLLTIGSRLPGGS